MNKKKSKKLTKNLVLATTIVAPFALIATVACNTTSAINEAEQLKNLVERQLETRFENVTNRTYSVFQGSKEFEFETLAETYNFLNDTKLTTASYYKLPGFANFPNSAEVDGSKLVLNSESQLVQVFKKADGTFTYAFSNDQAAINQARQSAALSYIQVHNGYQYDGYFFDNFNDVESFVRSLSEVELQKLIDGRETTQQMIRFNDGTVKSFANFSEIRHTIAHAARPYYTDNFGNLIEVNQANVNQIASGMVEDDLAYIPISSNDGKGTQLVDMDASTPNGQIYGPYLFQSGIGLDGVYDPLNWKPLTPNSQVTSYQETYEEQILNAFVSNLTLKQGVMFDDFVKLHKIQFDESGVSLEEYLSSVSSKVNYVALLNEFFNTIKRGARYTSLNSIILSRAFLMDKMIQNQEDTTAIIYVSKFYNAMARTLDDLLTGEVAPFLTGALKLDANKEPIQNDKIRINYFESTLAFDTANDQNNYAFQTDPGYYYRRLIGLDDKFKPVNQQNNSAIFKLIQASFGPLILMNDEVEKIKTAYNDSLSRINDSLKNLGTNTPQSSLHDRLKFKFDHVPSSTIFAGEANSNAQSREYELVWSLLDDTRLKGTVQYQTYDETSKTWINQSITGSKLRTNYDDFLVNSQNHILTQFVNNINAEVKKINDKVDAGSYSTYNEVWSSAEGKQILELDVPTFMAASVSLVVTNLPHTLRQRQEALQSSINGLLPSAADKWLSFSGNFLLPMFNVTTGVVISAQMITNFVRAKIKNHGKKDTSSTTNNGISDTDLETESTPVKNPIKNPVNLDKDDKQPVKLTELVDGAEASDYQNPVNPNYKDSDFEEFRAFPVLRSDVSGFTPSNIISTRVKPEKVRGNFVSYPNVPQKIDEASRENFIFESGYTIKEVDQIFFRALETPSQLNLDFRSMYLKFKPDQKSTFMANMRDAGLTSDDTFDFTLIKNGFRAYAKELENKMLDGTKVFRKADGTIAEPVTAYYDNLNGVLTAVQRAYLNVDHSNVMTGSGTKVIKTHGERLKLFKDFRNAYFGYEYKKPGAVANLFDKVTSVQNYDTKPTQLKVDEKRYSNQNQNPFVAKVNDVAKKIKDKFSKKPNTSDDQSDTSSVSGSSVPSGSPTPSGSSTASGSSSSSKQSIKSNSSENAERIGGPAFNWSLLSPSVLWHFLENGQKFVKTSVKDLFSKIKTTGAASQQTTKSDQSSWVKRVRSVFVRREQTNPSLGIEMTESDLAKEAQRPSFPVSGDIEVSKVESDINDSFTTNLQNFKFAKSDNGSDIEADKISTVSSAISDSTKSNAAKVSNALLSFQSVAMVSVGLSSLLGIAAAITQMISTFENIQIIPYEFKTREGVSLYWDGTRVTSQMWGLDNTINFSIKDLKMVTANVISGYTANEQGIYHNGKFYKDTVDVRKMQANSLVKILGETNQLEESFWDIEIPNIVWKINLAGFDNDLTFESIQALLDSVEANEGSISNAYNKVYHLINNKVTSSESATVTDVISALRQNLRQALIFKLPNSTTDGNLELGGFKLPEPYYSNGRKFEKPLATDTAAYDEWSKRAAKYIVYNQSINKEWLNLEAGKNAAERDILYEYFNKIFNTNIEVAYQSILAANLDKIVVPEKTTNTLEVLKTSKFDELVTNSTSNQVTVYSFVNKIGKVRYFTSQNAALEALQADGTSNVFTNDNVTTKSSYVYNGQTFASIEDVYAFAKKHN